MKRFINLTFSSILLSICLSSSAIAATERLIEHVAGDLYKVQDDNNYITTVLVTPDGAIVTDPVNAETANWMKDRIRKDFDVPVKYVIYSHSHGDHAPGAEVFEGAVIIAHENVLPALEGDPDNPAIPPNITFADRMTVKLGGKQVNLIYMGKGHGDNLIAMHFPDERAVYSVDNLWIDRVAWRTIGGSIFPDWFDGLRLLEEIDFDILIPGHGHLGEGGVRGTQGTKEDVTEFREYFEAVYNAVLDAKAQGLSLEEAKESITLEEFSHLGNYDLMFKENVEGVYLQTPPDSQQGH
jgi:glyoxylase-like metal-dependent hydrolase (beta-lactamase superfamily II)